MSDRAVDLIEILKLQPHPEGGHFREVFRSSSTVSPSDGRPERTALTTIYFLLPSGERSRVHRVQSDEVWHYYEGGPLQLMWWDGHWEPAGRAIIGSVSDGRQPAATIPAGCWQAAVPLGAYVLVGCTVAPGFEFADFAMLRDDRHGTEAFCRAQPEWAHLV